MFPLFSHFDTYEKRGYNVGAGGGAGWGETGVDSRETGQNVNDTDASFDVPSFFFFLVFFLFFFSFSSMRRV